MSDWPADLADTPVLLPRAHFRSEAAHKMYLDQIAAVVEMTFNKNRENKNDRDQKG